MSSHSGQYSIEELLALRESPLVKAPENLPQMEQWMQSPIDRRNLQASQSQGNTDADSKYRPSESRRSRGDSIILGPPPMSFASSLHSPPLRKTSNKEPIMSSMRNRPSPPHDDIILSTSPPEEEEEAGWSKVRSAARGTGPRAFERERRGTRGERRVSRGENMDGLPPKGAAFRPFREGESQNWRSERAELQALEQSRNGRREDRAESLEEDDFGGGGGGGKEHSAAEFQAWISRMRGNNPKSEETNEQPPNEVSRESRTTPEQPKIDKSKIVDVDSLFALEPPIPDENASTAPASSVFFDSAPTTGRASRFRQLFAQEPVPAPMNSFSPEPRPNAERINSNPLFNNGPKPGASEEDREGFQRIMSMLGGAGNKPNMSNFLDKSPPLQSPPPPPAMQDGQAFGESKNEFFQRLLRQGQPMGPNPPPFGNPPMQMNPRNNGPGDRVRSPPTDLDVNPHSRMVRPPPPPQNRSQHSDPRFSPYDLPPPPPPPQGAPWMHPPPGFSPPNGRFPFPGPPLSPGIPPPPGGFAPPPPGMMPYGGPPPGFGRGVFSPPLPPPGQDGWHGPPGFGGGGYYQDGDGRER